MGNTGIGERGTYHLQQHKVLAHQAQLRGSNPRILPTYIQRRFIKARLPNKGGQSDNQENTEDEGEH
jgi:hypothetical protein